MIHYMNPEKMSGGPKGRPSKKELIKMIYRKLKRVNYELYVKFSNLSKWCIPYAILESVYQNPHPYEMIFTVSDELSKEERRVELWGDIHINLLFQDRYELWIKLKTPDPVKWVLLRFLSIRMKLNRLLRLNC